MPALTQLDDDQPTPVVDFENAFWSMISTGRLSPHSLTLKDQVRIAFPAVAPKDLELRTLSRNSNRDCWEVLWVMWARYDDRLSEPDKEALKRLWIAAQQAIDEMAKPSVGEKIFSFWRDVTI